MAFETSATLAVEIESTGGKSSAVDIRPTGGWPSFGKRRAAHLRLGQRGERMAARLLQELGLEVLMRNYRHGKGEIDIVARDGEVLCFVEVKTRRHARRGRPADAVGREKRRMITQTGQNYLRELGWPQVAHRFDIVELVIPRWQVEFAAYHRAAFTDEPQSRRGRNQRERQ